MKCLKNKATVFSHRISKNFLICQYALYYLRRKINEAEDFRYNFPNLTTKFNFCVTPLIKSVLLHPLWETLPDSHRPVPEKGLTKALFLEKGTVKCCKVTNWSMSSDTSYNLSLSLNLFSSCFRCIYRKDDVYNNGLNKFWALIWSLIT